MKPSVIFFKGTLNQIFSRKALNGYFYHEKPLKPNFYEPKGFDCRQSNTAFINNYQIKITSWQMQIKTIKRSWCSTLE